MKVIFLDVDGVLNHSGCPEWEQGDHRVLDPECVRRVREVCDRTGARIVVSSTWRLGNGMDILRAEFGPRIIGETPSIDRKVGGLYVSVPRRDEIAAWIDEHPDVTPACVIDDEWDAGLLGVAFVKTSFTGGGFTDNRMRAVEKSVRGAAPSPDPQGTQK